MSAPALPPPCPLWCADHVPADTSGVLHVGTTQVLELTSPCVAEHGATSVSVERLDRTSGQAGPIGIRIEGAPAVMSLDAAARLVNTVHALMDGARPGKQANRRA